MNLIQTKNGKFTKNLRFCDNCFELPGFRGSRGRRIDGQQRFEYLSNRSKQIGDPTSEAGGRDAESYEAGGGVDRSEQGQPGTRLAKGAETTCGKGGKEQEVRSGFYGRQAGEIAEFDSVADGFVLAAEVEKDTGGTKRDVQK